MLLLTIIQDILFKWNEKIERANNVTFSVLQKSALFDIRHTRCVRLWHNNQFLVFVFEGEDKTILIKFILYFIF